MRIILSAISLLFIIQLSAKNVNFFNEDIESIKNEFTEINNIENQILNITSFDSKTLLHSHLIFKASSTMQMMQINGPFGLPSFLWGCILPPVGFIFVAIMTDGDREEVKSAALGCLVSSCIFGGGFFYWFKPVW